MDKDDVTVCYSLRLPRSVMLQAQEFKVHSRQRCSLNDVFVRSIRNFLDPAEADQREVAIARRLAFIDKKQEKLNRMLEVYSQALAVFIQTYLTTTSEVPADQQKVAAAMGNRRWKRFMEVLSKDLGYGKTLLNQLSDTVFKADDFKTTSKVVDEPKADTSPDHDQKEVTSK